MNQVKNSSSCYLWDRKSKLEEITKDKFLKCLVQSNYCKTDIVKSIKNLGYANIVKNLHIDKMAPGIHVFPVGNQACIILINKTKQQLEKVLKLDKEDSANDKDIKLIEVTDPKLLNRFYKNWSITWEGMDIGQKNLRDIKAAINEAKGKFDGTFYYIKGKFFNEYYKLTGNNAYPDSLSILVIDNENCKGKDNLIMWIRQCGARWYTDIVDNNKRRQKGE